MRILPPTALLLGVEVALFSRKAARDLTKRLSPNDIYTGAKLPSAVWSLEHVVPQSRIQSPGRKNDLHNLAGLHTRLNSRRGNKAFGEPAEFRQHHGCEISPLLLCPVVGRGEVARKCAYMASQYGGSVDLPRVISIDTMLEWNERFPPTDEEKRKNDIIYAVQGTYNQFVVDPSELNMVFDGTLAHRLVE